MKKNNLSFLIGFFYPLQVIGITIFDFPVNIPFVIIVIYFLFLFPFPTKQNKSIYLLVFGLIFIQIIHLFELFEWLKMSAFILPLLVLSNLDGNSFLKGFQYSIYYTVVIVIYEFLIVFFDFPLLSETVLSWVDIEIRDSYKFGIYRFKGVFSEPAHFSAYLSILFLLNSTNKNKMKYLNILILVSLLFTFSIIGILCYLLVMIYKVNQTERRNLIITALTILIVIYLVYFDNYFLTRIYSAVNALETLNLSGSEGSRVGSIIVIWDYIVHGNFFGEGYGNIENWILGNFSVNGELSSFYYGKVNNIFAVILLSFGLLGLSTYLIWLFSWLRYGKWPLIILVLWLHFSFGMLSGTLFLTLLFTLKFYFDEKSYYYMS